MDYESLLEEYRRFARSDRPRARAVAMRYRNAAKREGDRGREAQGELLLAELDAGGGRLRSAISRFRRSAELARRGGSRQGVFQARLGEVQSLASLGDGAGVRRARRALASTATEPLTSAYADIASGNALGQLGEEREAERCLREALKSLGRSRKRAAASARATARLNLGIRLARRGAMAEAQRHLAAAERFFGAESMPLWGAIARHNRGWALGQSGDLVAAFRELRGAGEDFLAAGDRRRAALAELDEAELRLRLGDHGGARTASAKAARVLSGLGALPDAARARMVESRALAGLGKDSLARKRAEAARDWFAQSGDRAGVALAETRLGLRLGRAERVLRETGHLLGALEALLARCASLSPAAGERLLRRSLARYPRVLQKWVAPELHRLRAAAAPAGTQAITHLRRAVRAAEDLRLRAPTGSLRGSVLAAHLDCYGALAEALLDRGTSRDLREAFLVLDAARARTLREELARAAPGLAESPRVRALRARLEELWRTLEARESGSEGLREAARSIAREVQVTERELLVRLEAESMLAHGAAPDRRLPDDPCLVFDVVGGDVIGLLCVEGRVAAWPCGPVRAIRAEMGAFEFQVARRLHGSATADVALDLLGRLGRRLLDQAPELPEGTPLCVVTAHELGGIPVGALSRNGEPLIERLSIYHAPAASPGRGVSGRRGRGSLIVGIDDGDLPDVRREVRMVASRLGEARRLEGPETRRESLLDSISGRNLIHLAGHAHARDDLPPMSALRVHDGWLTASDLANARLDGTLVVLSACRSGDPSLRWRGEALAGFPRALLAAGAEGVVANRWEIRDGIAYRWMQEFYRHLSRARATPLDALTATARAMRRESGHPAEWASFLLIRAGGRGGA